MGKAKRQGRHAKQKPWERERRNRPKPPEPNPPPPPVQRAPQPPLPAPPAEQTRRITVSPAARAEELVSDALQAQMDGDQEAFARCADALAAHPGSRDWQRAVDRELLVSLVRAVTAGWRQGWQPAEVVREVGRRFGARHARMATDVAAMEMRNYARTAVDERWQAQLTALGAIAWWGSDEGYLERWRERERVATATSVTCALEVLFGLATLPRLGRLCPLPGTARPGAPASQRGQGHGGRVTGRPGHARPGPDAAGPGRGDRASREGRVPDLAGPGASRLPQHGRRAGDGRSRAEPQGRRRPAAVRGQPLRIGQGDAAGRGGRGEPVPGGMAQGPGPEHRVRVCPATWTRWN